MGWRETDNCGGGVWRFERSWVSSASPPRDGGERTRRAVREARGGGCWHEGGGRDEPRERWWLLLLSPSLVPRRLDPVQVLAAWFSSWPPRAASSCWVGPQCLIQSWSQSLRRTLTQRYLWGWCTGCCQTTSIQPGAGRSPSLSPEHGLHGQKQRDLKMI